MNPLRWWRIFGARKRQDLEWFPPWWTYDMRLIENRDNWRHVRLLLPLGLCTRNMGGSMFGGAQASVADPIAAMACANIFPGHAVWTRSMTIDFRAPGNSDLELRFDFAAEIETQIRSELDSTGRSDPTFEFGLYRSDGIECTHVINTVAIRPRTSRTPASAYTPPGG